MEKVSKKALSCSFDMLDDLFNEKVLAEVTIPEEFKTFHTSSDGPNLDCKMVTVMALNQVTNGNKSFLIYSQKSFQDMILPPISSSILFHLSHTSLHNIKLFGNYIANLNILNEHGNPNLAQVKPMSYFICWQSCDHDVADALKNTIKTELEKRTQAKQACED
jgi:hypothetical protein